MPVNIILSTTIDILYKCIVSAGLTYAKDHSFHLIHLITFNKCKLQFEGETSQNLNKRINWHNTCFKNPSANFFCNISNAYISKVYCKDLHLVLILLKNLTGRDVQTGVLWILPLNQFEAREAYKTHELWTIFPYFFNDRIVDEFKPIINTLCCYYSFVFTKKK